MFEFSLRRIKSLSVATFPLTRLGAERAHMKCSPAMFSLTISNASPRFIASLRIAPQFFTHFFSTDDNHSSIHIHSFYDTVTDGYKFSSMTFTFRDHTPKAFFQFQRGGHNVYGGELTLLYSEEEHIDQIDYTTFVSIGAKEFRRVIEKFRHVVEASHECLVCVHLTNTQVRFFAVNHEITFTKEGRECLIEGIGTANVIQLVINLHPIAFFEDLTSRSERLWLYKTVNHYSVIIAPIRKFVQFMIYFPNR